MRICIDKYSHLGFTLIILIKKIKLILFLSFLSINIDAQKLDNSPINCKKFSSYVDYLYHLDRNHRGEMLIDGKWKSNEVPSIDHYVLNRLINLLDVCGIDSIDRNKTETAVFWASALHNCSQNAIKLFDKLYLANQKGLFSDASFYNYLSKLFIGHFGYHPVFLDRRGLSDSEKNEGMLQALQAVIKNKYTGVKLDSSLLKCTTEGTFYSEVGDTVKIINQEDKNYLIYKRREPFENIYAVEKTSFNLHPQSSGLAYKFLNPYNTKIYFILKNGSLGVYDTAVKRYSSGFQKMKSK